MSKHTPGPWEVLDDECCTSVVIEYGDICDIVQDDRPEAENLANARLIAAATEMLEALEMAQFIIDLGKCTESQDAICLCFCNYDKMVDMVEGALKKARGEE